MSLKIMLPAIKLCQIKKIFLEFKFLTNRHVCVPTNFNNVKKLSLKIVVPAIVSNRENICRTEIHFQQKYTQACKHIYFTMLKS